MEKEFVIRSYGYGELAQLYFKHISKKSATDQFRKWIKSSKKLKYILEELGYKPRQRILTPRQVREIIEEFGEP